MGKGAGSTRSVDKTHKKGSGSRGVPENNSSMYEHLASTLYDDIDKNRSIDLIMRETNVGEEKAEKFYKALMDYTEDNKVDTDTLEEFISRSPKWNGESTYRAMVVDDKTLKSYKEGKVISPNKIQSWTTDKYFAITHTEEESGNKVLFINSDSQPRGTSIVHASAYPTDSEVLVSKKAKYRVVGVNKISSYTSVYVEPV